MPKAIWNGAVLAESNKTQVVEGNQYFPPDSINWDYFQKSSHATTCPWKGVAGYYDLAVDGQVNPTPPGIMPSLPPLPPGSKITSPSGTASKSY